MAEVAGGNDDIDVGDDAMCHLVLFFVDPSVFDITTPFFILITGGVGGYKDASRTKHFLGFP